MSKQRKPVVTRVGKTDVHVQRACNLCAETFVTRFHYHYFCDRCRAGSEVYRFGDWLPDADEGTRATLAERAAEAPKAA